MKEKWTFQDIQKMVHLWYNVPSSEELTFEELDLMEEVLRVHTILLTSDIRPSHHSS